CYSTGQKNTGVKLLLYKFWPGHAEESTNRLTHALLTRDFQSLSEIIMRDSNNMHATMLDTYPPIMYLTDKSREIIYAVHDLNEVEGKNVAGYTFDAGANAHIITLSKYRSKVRGILNKIVDDNKIKEVSQGSGPRLLGKSDS